MSQFTLFGKLKGNKLEFVKVHIADCDNVNMVHKATQSFIMMIRRVTCISIGVHRQCRPSRWAPIMHVANSLFTACGY